MTADERWWNTFAAAQLVKNDPELSCKVADSVAPRPIPTQRTEGTPFYDMVRELALLRYLETLQRSNEPTRARKAYDAVWHAFYLGDVPRDPNEESL